ncbi:hypothetical protein GCM10010169_41220 [Micromonospora fulviviridis]|uniref:hypothetical protein n=1 Tax=Micromonospora fulviviridis TaxID=47860 RepID=UPI0016683E73|nr:hypothetical protein [Micromonospora fulviviridis]GGR92514.1 hypothetical protein GCM10010169_41220 [Micromonospora fulviviridis]
MLPIALTCPVWWVARWIARTLASLAVLAACSFGAAALPVGGAAAAPAASSAVAPVGGPTLQPGAAAQHLRDGAGWTATVTGRHFPDAAGRTAAVTGWDPRGTAARTAAVAGRDLDGGAGVDRQAVPADRSEPVAASRAVARPADRPLVLAGLVPATVGSRAPPGR